MQNTQAKLAAFNKKTISERYLITTYHGRHVTNFQGIHYSMEIWILDDEYICLSYYKQTGQLTSVDMLEYCDLDFINEQIDLPI